MAGEEAGVVVEEAGAMDIPSTSTSDAHEDDAHLTQLNFNHELILIV